MLRGLMVFLMCAGFSSTALADSLFVGNWYGGNGHHRYEREHHGHEHHKHDRGRCQSYHGYRYMTHPMYHPSYAHERTVVILRDEPQRLSYHRASPISWEAPQAYEHAENRYCREFTRSIMVGGRRQEGYGRACMQPDGSWVTVNE